MVKKKKVAAKRNLYLFYDSDYGKNIVYVFAIDSSSLSMNFVTKLRSDSEGMGCIAHGGKLYAISSDRAILVCDLSKGKEWNEGPLLNAGKPNPMVVAVKGKIYALAGQSFSNEPKDSKSIDPTFEVLDSGNVWFPLPNPPFYSWYRTRTGPGLLCYTVIGNVIYVLVPNPEVDDWDTVLYSFNVVKKRWKKHSRGVLSGDRIGDTLKNHGWGRCADVANCKLYLSDANAGECRLYAHDLNAKKQKDFNEANTGECRLYDDDLNAMKLKVADETTNVVASSPPALKIRDGDSIDWGVAESPYLDDCDCDGVPYVDLRVKLLDFFDPSIQRLVVHLGNQMLLVLCTYNPPRKFCFDDRLIYTCLLKIVEKKSNVSETSGGQNSRDCVVMVKHKYHKISHKYNSIGAWSTM